MWALVEDDSVVDVWSGEKPLAVSGIKYPRNIMTLWSVGDLKAIGVYRYNERGKKNETFYDNGQPVLSIDNPQGIVNADFTPVEKFPIAEAKAGQVRNIRIRVQKKYSEFIDSEYLKKYREEAEGGSYTVPTKIKSYVTALKANYQAFKTSVANATTFDELEAVQMDWPEEP